MNHHSEAIDYMVAEKLTKAAALLNSQDKKNKLASWNSVFSHVETIIARHHQILDLEDTAQKARLLSDVDTVKTYNLLWQIYREVSAPTIKDQDLLRFAQHIKQIFASTLGVDSLLSTIKQIDDLAFANAHLFERIEQNVRQESERLNSAKEEMEREKQDLVHERSRLEELERTLVAEKTMMEQSIIDLKEKLFEQTQLNNTLLREQRDREHEESSNHALLEGVSNGSRILPYSMFESTEQKGKTDKRTKDADIKKIRDSLGTNSGKHCDFIAQVVDFAERFPAHNDVVLESVYRVFRFRFEKPLSEIVSGLLTDFSDQLQAAGGLNSIVRSFESEKVKVRPSSKASNNVGLTKNLAALFGANGVYLPKTQKSTTFERELKEYASSLEQASHHANGDTSCAQSASSQHSSRP